MVSLLKTQKLGLNIVASTRFRLEQTSTRSSSDCVERVWSLGASILH